jgi:hypothetical protein
MAEALTASSRRYEVAIRKQDWDDYLDRHQLEEQAPYEPKKGRHQLPAWRDIAIVIGAYLRKHHAISTNEIKIEEAAKKIHAIAKKRDIAHPPAWTTIKDVLSAIRQLADSLSID